jgi:hypothetical protein
LHAIVVNPRIFSQPLALFSLGCGQCQTFAGARGSYAESVQPMHEFLASLELAAREIAS